VAATGGPQISSELDQTLTRGSGNWVILALLVAVFASYLYNLVASPFLPAMATDLGTTVGLIGQVVAFTYLVATLFGLIAGPLADGLGQRRILLLGLLALVVGAFGWGFSSTYLALFLAALFVGLGLAACMPIALAIASTRFPESRRRQAVSWASAGASIAALGGVPLLASIGGPLGWRAAFYFLGALTLVATLVVYLSLEPDRRLGGVGVGLRGALATYPLPLRHRPTLLLLASNLPYYLCLAAVGSYLGAFYIQRHGYSAEQVGWLFMVWGAVNLAGTWAVAGRIGALPTRPLVTLTRAISGLSVGGVFLLPVAALAAAGLFAIHAFVTAIVGVGMTLLLSREAPGGKATAQSLLAVSGSLGTALGAALGGLLLTVSDYQVVGLVAALFGLVSAALIWWSRPRAAEMPVAGVGQ